MILRTSSGSGGSGRTGRRCAPRVVRRVPGDVRLPLVRVDVHVVDEGARHLDVAHAQAAARRQLADLGDDDAPAVARRHGHREHLALDRLALHREVAVLVGGRPADHGDVDREGVEQQPFPAAERDDLDEVLGRPGVLLATGLARIDERAKPDLGDQPGRPAAISRMSCDSTPWGNEYDSISFASTSAPSLGSLPMLLPIVRRMRPGSPSCEKPRSAKSPIPTTLTVVRSRGRPCSA